jgi:hypothetical protein
MSPWTSAGDRATCSITGMRVCDGVGGSCRHTVLPQTSSERHLRHGHMAACCVDQ